jgi:hypothetical protein
VVCNLIDETILGPSGRYPDSCNIFLDGNRGMAIPKYDIDGFFDSNDDEDAIVDVVCNKSYTN